MQEAERIYRCALRFRRDDAVALTYLLAAAQMGHAVAQVAAGKYLVYGWGSDADPTRGFALLEEAAAAGSGDAYWRLAYFHRNGIGSPRDPERALRYAIRGWNATRTGHCATMAGDIYAEDLFDETRAFKWSLRGAKAGDTDGMTTTGLHYRYGKGVEEDRAEAVRWYRRAARRGCPHAHNNLGICYRNGEGVKADRRRAFAHRLRAAELGHGLSRVVVAAWRIDGYGVRRDVAKGVAALRRLARTDPRAALELGDRMLDGQGVPKNVRSGLRWLQKAAAAGESSALTSLGVHHYYGRGVPEDRDAAVRYYRAAATKGNGVAWRNLGLCYRDGHGVPRDPAKARLCFAAAREHEYACDDDGNLPGQSDATPA